MGYYAKVTGYTNNYCLVNGAAANNYMGLNNAKSLFGGTAFTLPVAATNYSITGNYGSMYYDGTNLVINPAEVGSGGLSLLNKLGVFGAAPVAQPTTGGAAATFVANTSGVIDDSATFDNYTIGQIVKALRNVGLLA